MSQEISDHAKVYEGGNWSVWIKPHTFDKHLTNIFT